MSYSLHSSIQTFGADLFSQIAPSSSTNVCFSPFNIAACFAMLIEGADGDTRKLLMDAFHLPKNFQSEFKDHSKAIKHAQSTIRSAHSIWASNKVRLDDDYLFYVKRMFKNAKVESTDFGSLDVVKKINQFVNKKTRGLIPEVLSALNINTLLVLVSVLYFKGQWCHPFKQSLTTPRPFHLLDNNAEVQVPMMAQTLERYEFTRQPTFSAISLPFSGRDTSMIFILPKDNTTSELNRMCSTEFLTEFFAHKYSWMRSQLVDVTIPKFKFECEFDLTTLLPSLGVTDAFSTAANFSKMTKSGTPVYVNTAVHKTFISVDEKGCEAAAATAVCLLEFGIKKPQQFETFYADHPFVFILYHQVTQQVLFIGRVVDPTNGAKSEKKRAADDLEDKEFQREHKKQKH